MKKIIKKFRNKLIGTDLSNMNNVINKLLSQQEKFLSQQEKSLSTQEKMKILESNENSKFLLPLDYPPSSDYEPRYGYKKKLSNLDNFFSEFDDEIFEFLSILKDLDYSKIPYNSDLDLKGFGDGPMNALDLICIMGIVKTYKPKKIIEIGSGISTHFFRRSINMFLNQENCKLISIDPSPRIEIKDISDEIFYSFIEDLDLDLFLNLQENDIIFFDGSHRTFMNSDVTIFFLEILQMLKPGVIVHFHDIFLPEDYPTWSKSYYWNEQYMLAVYLMENLNKKNFEFIFPINWITKQKKFNIKNKFIIDFKDGQRNRYIEKGGSFWFKKK